MKAHKTVARTVVRRPAETAMPIATVVALLICRALDVDSPDTVAYVAVVVSFVPAAVTWLVDLYRGKGSS